MSLTRQEEILIVLKKMESLGLLEEIKKAALADCPKVNFSSPHSFAEQSIYATGWRDGIDTLFAKLDNTINPSPSSGTLDSNYTDENLL